jgi:hypothetical protein
MREVRQVAIYYYTFDKTLKCYLIKKYFFNGGVFHDFQQYWYNWKNVHFEGL